MPKSGVSILYGLTLFVSAFLLFWVEPLLGKLLLPVFGGAPAIWNVCLLFFQAALLGGYVYAHGISSRTSFRPGAIFHVSLFLAAAAFLPVSLHDAVGAYAQNQASPALQILKILGLCIGVPFLFLSATSSLAQSWLSGSSHAKADDPYFLYAVSNAGSLIALALYPWVIEPFLSVETQWRLWKQGYLVLAILIGLCAVWRDQRGSHKPLPAVPVARVGVAPARAFRWMAWSFVPSSLLLGVTSYFSTDIIAVPLLWVIPLMIYLGTFAFVFAKPSFARWAIRPVFTLLLGLGAMFCLLGMAAGLNHPAPFFLSLHLAFFVVACLVCLGRVAADRPSTQELTRFYLYIALGGMLGAVFNGLVAPLVFNEISEYPLAIVLACLCLPGRWKRLRPWQFALGLGVFYFVGATSMAHRGQELLYRERTFFGTLKVLSKPEEKLVYLVHGSTSHGAQSTDPARSREPLTYYSRQGPAGQIFDEFHKKALIGAKVGVIGLGAGTLAAYARTGESWTFFELDPGVVEIARNPAYFTYLKDAAVTAGIVLGDARLRVHDVPDGSLSLLIVDAFSSDSVPAHLMTREAQALYMTKLAPGGFMAFHVSNRFLRLAPVVGAVASALGAVARVRTDVHGYGVATRIGESPSIWTVVARTDGDLGGIARDERWKALPANPRFAWTDDFYDLIGLIRW